MDIKEFKEALLKTVVKGLYINIEDIEEFISFNKYVTIKLKDDREFKIYPVIK